MQVIRAEFHVHTVLSPCADIEMIPPLIVQEAIDRGIGIIAITDHNSSANVIAVQKAAHDKNLLVLPGMEIQTQEEIHLLGIFENVDDLRVMQTIVDNHISRIKNNPDFFGEQFVVDETGDFINREDQLLITSLDLSVEECVNIIHEIGGLAIPAHIDRKAFGLIANLGFIPDYIPFDGVELSKNINPEIANVKYTSIEKFPVIQSGDAHRLEDILGLNLLTIKHPSFSEIAMALANLSGRSLQIMEFHQPH